MANIDFVVQTSMLCNLRCRYCDVYPLLSDRRRMSLEQITRMFENVLSGFQTFAEPVNINFQWHGGEPLLLPPSEFRRIFEAQRQVFAGSIHRITNGVQSNFTVLDDERIALLRECFDHIGVSLDLFTELRVNTRGVCQEPRALANLERARAAGLRVSGITVLSGANASRVRDIYGFYRERRMDFRMLPLAKGLYQQGQSFELGPREIVKALIELADAWLDDVDPLDSVEPIQRYLYLVRHSLAHPLNRVVQYDKRRWDPVLMISTDGRVRGYGERFESELAAGNIFTTSLREILDSPTHAAASAQASARMQSICKSCTYFGRACTGDPIAEGQQDFTEPDEHGKLVCIVARGLIQHLEQRLRAAPLAERRDAV